MNREESFFHSVLGWLAGFKFLHRHAHQPRPGLDRSLRWNLSRWMEGTELGKRGGRRAALS
ncbi:MAG: hypothetical protein ACP5UD_08925 [Conexivisphaera sp.]